MKNAVFFTSGKSNRYLYSPYRKQLRLCHPLIPYLFKLGKNGTNLTQWFSSIQQKGELSINGAGVFTSDEVGYQLRKYRFLKKHGFLKPAKTINLQGRLKPSDVRKNISSVKQIIFEVTEDCNLSCTYCTYSKFYINKKRTNRYLSFKEVQYSLKKLISSRTPSPSNQLIISFYGGEPLKNFSFIKSVVHFTQRYPKDQYAFKYSLSSNGLLLKKHIRFLVEHSFEISVSLDGDEIANSFRLTKNDKPSYDIVTKNLDFVRDHYPDYFDKNISFLTVLHRRNSFYSVYDFFNTRYGKLPMISDVNPVNLSPDHEHEFREKIQMKPVTAREEQLSAEKLKNRHPKVKEMARAVEYYSGFVFKNYFEMISSGRDKPKVKKFIPTATCTPFSIRAYFTTDGSIIPCEHISPFYEIGHYKANRLDLNSKWITNLYNSYYDKMARFCEKCYFSDNCQECMFNADIEEEQPNCAFYLQEAGFREYLKKQYSNIENNYEFYLKTAQAAFYEV